MSESKDFLRTKVESDLQAGNYQSITTRFPPEPNGFPHIGHAKSININFGIARDYNGVCNLRMDDTNPTTEDTQYVEALKDAVLWLGYEWDGNVRYTSDYFAKLYEYAIALIKMGKAYVDSLSEEQMREYRGTVTQAGKRSEFANRSVEENLTLFEQMKNGEFSDGEHVLRAKIDMGAANMKMRDPLLYRIRHAHHFRAGDAWCVYPMYDFAHCLSDYIEGVTHSICTLEFENNRDIYDWVLDTLALKPPRPYQHEFARLNINYTVMSKRKLLELVNTKAVEGWDDPRMPTIAGLRRRGYTKEAVLNFCDQIGIAKANSTVDVSQLEYCIRDDLNTKVPRVMCVLEPLKVTLSNYEGSELLDASYYPEDINETGSRQLPFSKTLYIEQGDFSENPPKGYFRLTPTQSVRLKHAYIITFEEAIKDANGKIVEIIAAYHPDSKSGSDTSGIKVKSAIHWVDAANSKTVELRLYDRLYANETPQSMDDLNPESLRIISTARIEPAVIHEKPNERYQFERQGYFYADPLRYSDDAPSFTKIVGLKESWGKQENKLTATEKKVEKKAQIDGEVVPMSAEQEASFLHFTQQLHLNNEVANTLARDAKLCSFFNATNAMANNAATIANLVANDVARLFKESPDTTPTFEPLHISMLAQLIDDETISSKIAKQVFENMTQTGKNPHDIVKEQGLEQISDPAAIEAMIIDVMQNNQENVKAFQAGNKKLMGFFVGQVLKKSGGKANPKLVNALVAKLLAS